MANVELVIRIPEDEYQRILLTGKANFCVANAIEAGTVLPKGHGKLKDVDKFPVNEIERIEYNYECGENECRSEEIVYLDDIISAETIIEADTEN